MNVHSLLLDSIHLCTVNSCLAKAHPLAIPRSFATALGIRLRGVADKTDKEQF